MSDAQVRAARAALRTLVTWSVATKEPEHALVTALQRENPAEVMVGLAAVGRMLAVELGICTGRDEVTVLADLRDILTQLHTS
jgi:hypothetical protein